jgi:hypothetical protein
MKPFLVDAIGVLLAILSKLNVFQHIVGRFSLDKKKRGALTEMWILGNLLLSILLLTFLPASPLFWVVFLAAVWAVLRVSEIVIFQVNSQIYGAYPGKKAPRLHYTVLSYRRSIFIAVILYFEAILWFANLYRVNWESFHFSGLPLSHPGKALYYSFVTMTTIGYGDVYPETPWGFAIVIGQSITAVLMIVLIIARIVTYLPTPHTLDVIERKRALWMSLKRRRPSNY